MIRILTILCFLIAVSLTVQAQKALSAGEQPAQKQVIFYPNPATAFINFEFKTPVRPGFVLQLYSFLGRRMGNLPVLGQRMQVNLSDYTTGVYVFQLRDASGRLVESNKFQVAK